MDLTSPQHVNPDIPVDRFPSYREWQIPAIEQTVAALEGGAKVVFIDAPTGAGKTLIAESVRALYAGPYNSTPYLCTTKTLQDQILGDFPYAKVLKGRDNYPTRFNPDLFPNESCGDCDPETIAVSLSDPPDWLEREIEIKGSSYGLVRHTADGRITARKCALCGVQPLCPYVVARDEAVVAPLCVTNMAYYLREANGPARLSQRALVIADEADAFTDTILDTFTVDIPQWIMYWPGFPIPETASRDDDIEDWITRMGYFLQGVLREVDSTSYKERFGARKQRNRTNTVEHLIRNLSVAEVEDWHYDGPSKKARKQYRHCTLRPVVIGDWIHEFVWDHARQWVLMSASFVSIELEAHRLKLRPSQIAKVKVPYAFDPERRPVLYWPSDKPYTRATANSGYNVVADMAKKIRQISEWYPDERILVHTVSHERTRGIAELLSDLERPVLWFDEAASRDVTIEKYRETEAAILLGAGLERGYDFKYDECRVCVIAKTPFADLGDPVVGIRMRRGREGDAWYSMVTIRNTVQMVGRGMRAADDTLITYLLDRSFEDYLRGRNSKLVPPEFRDAVKFGLPLDRHKLTGV